MEQIATTPIDFCNYWISIFEYYTRLSFEIYVYCNVISADIAIFGVFLFRRMCDRSRTHESASGVMAAGQWEQECWPWHSPAPCTSIGGNKLTTTQNSDVPYYLWANAGKRTGSNLLRGTVRWQLIRLLNKSLSRGHDKKTSKHEKRMKTRLCKWVHRVIATSLLGENLFLSRNNIAIKQRFRINDARTAKLVVFVR